MATWDNGLAQMKQLWTDLTTAQQVALVGTAVGILGALIGLAMWFSTADYTMLYGGLSPEDASEIVESLKAEKVPYKLDDGGKTIRVPAEKVYDLRLSLAAKGIPAGGEVGFEIFDNFSFGMTDFTQRLQYLRALEGELTRTIKKMSAVDGVRVHLVMPEKSLFEERSEPATASVVLRLKRNGQLSKKQVQAVVHLVSGSVQGLSPEHVTVVDTSGNLLHDSSSGDDGSAMASSQFEYKTLYEKEAERRVREMLEHVYGQGSAVVKVSATFNFDKVEQTAEIYDPDKSVIRSEARSSSDSKGGNTTISGVPGVASNVGPSAAQSQGANQSNTTSSNSESETINYEVSRTITKTQKSVGALERLTVAVAVDGTYKEPATAGGPKEFVPRSDAEIARIAALVENAAGVDPNRGDKVEVSCIPFATVDMPGETVLDRSFYLVLVKYAVGLVVALLLFLFLIRPFMRMIFGSKVSGENEIEILAPVSLDQLEREMKVESERVAQEAARVALASAERGPGGMPGMPGRGPIPPGIIIDDKTPEETLKREALRSHLLELISNDPEVAANLVKTWMAEND